MIGEMEMNKKKILSLVGLTAAAMLFGFVEKNEAAEMHRLYNPNSGEHFYTGNSNEKEVLTNKGWQYEGTGWVAPEDGDPVYRMYNKNSGDHHYTMNADEKTMLERVGWTYEGIGWRSSTGKETPLYRAYNPNAKAGSHNYTTNNAEQQSLLRAGWKDEGLAWYGIAPGKPVVPPVKPPVTNNVPPRKVDENITTTGGGEGKNEGSYRYLYSNKPFDNMPVTNEEPTLEFSADMMLIGPAGDENYGMQFVIAGNGEGSGQIGLDIGFQAGTSADFAQNRVAVKTVNFPAGAGNHGEQYYSVNTAAQMNLNQMVHIAVQYYQVNGEEFVITRLNNQLVGSYKTRLTTPNLHILHAQIEDWKGRDASLKLTNVQVKAKGVNVTDKGAPPLHMAANPSIKGTAFDLKAGTPNWLIQGAY